MKEYLKVCLYIMLKDIDAGKDSLFTKYNKGFRKKNISQKIKFYRSVFE